MADITEEVNFEDLCTNCEQMELDVRNAVIFFV